MSKGNKKDSLKIEGKKMTVFCCFKHKHALSISQFSLCLVTGD